MPFRLMSLILNGKDTLIGLRWAWVLRLMLAFETKTLDGSTSSATGRSCLSWYQCSGMVRRCTGFRTHSIAACLNS